MEKTIAQTHSEWITHGNIARLQYALEAEKDAGKRKWLGELLQEQRLDAPHAVELIFKAYRVDFTRPSREQILRDIGMTPDDVSQLLEDVDRRQEDE